MHEYCNSLFFRCKNIFVRRKCTKIFYANIILHTAKIFTTVRGPCENYLTGIFFNENLRDEKIANYGI